ncbi:MAG: sulfotransferase [Pseudomonadota bacterium]
MSQDPHKNRFIHIVGMYKCGTSWLLHVFASHPQVAAWREFDPILASFDRDRRWWRLPMLVCDYLLRRPDSQAWMRRQEAIVEKPQDLIFRDMFLGRGWIPVMGAELQQRAARLKDTTAESALEQVLKLSETRLRRSDAPLIDPSEHAATLGHVNFRHNDLVNLMTAVRSGQAPGQTVKLFYSALSEQVKAPAVVACKAADQLQNLRVLKDLIPESKQVAIIRDGRDAAVSAFHFESQMRKVEAPWRVRNSSFNRRLLGWAARAAKLAEHAKQGELVVVRYEDLMLDFEGICRALFAQLKLDNDDRLIASIKANTSFEAVAQSKEQGRGEPVHLVRKGMVGEWRKTFTSREARSAMRLAGAELDVFGYGSDGALKDSDYVLKPSANRPT